MLVCDAIWRTMYIQNCYQLSCDYDVMGEHLFICSVYKISLFFSFFLQVKPLSRPCSTLYEGDNVSIHFP